MADTLTPVSIYQKVREKFSNSILLESSDYGVNDNSYAYICFNPISHISIKKQQIEIEYPDQKKKINIKTGDCVVEQITGFCNSFKCEINNKNHMNNGVFGYTNYDAVKYFEDIVIEEKNDELDIPSIFYAFYTNIIVVNVFNNEAILYNHCLNQSNNLDEIHDLIFNNKLQNYPFTTKGNIECNMSDKDYIKLVKKESIIV